MHNRYMCIYIYIYILLAATIQRQPGSQAEWRQRRAGHQGKWAGRQTDRRRQASRAKQACLGCDIHTHAHAQDSL